MNLHYGRKSVGQILDLNFIRPPPLQKIHKFNCQLCRVNLIGLGLMALKFHDIYNFFDPCKVLFVNYGRKLIN
jgi:hypothetical protein